MKVPERISLLIMLVSFSIATLTSVIYMSFSSMIEFADYFSTMNAVKVVVPAFLLGFFAMVQILKSRLYNYQKK